MSDPEYAVADLTNVPVTSMADVPAVHDEFDPLDVLDVDEALSTDRLRPKVWRVPPGERMGAHGHETQEEFYHVLRGRFAVRIGLPGDTEPGTAFAASSDVVREYENVGEEPGLVLVVAAPPVDEGGIPEAEMVD